MVAHKFLDASQKPYTPKQIRLEMSLEFGISMSYKKSWKAQKTAMQKQFGSDADSYQLLPSMAYILAKSNHGSSIDLIRGVDNEFRYFFFSLAAWIQTWEFYRPVLIVDGSFMKAYYKGSKASWLWFLFFSNCVIHSSSDRICIFCLIVIKV
ncbi:unnamed protein product [Cuscuta europaea]|uniref:Uncharacterized protein n=1 Tax=Cuscuta europaea TaxID=41803 RepID=A0A9P0YU75_CUSEU|nr:unnamed protein product [Cuscuta europaea]